MCGINGFVDTETASPPAERSFTLMRDCMRHRGPDDAGLYLAPGVALGARRLAVIDLSERGHMPMSTPDGRFWIVYNGEIFNFRELRADLIRRGYWFRSQGDTEVVLYLYAEEGPGALEKINGMFSLAVWDAQERVLFLARDRQGIKPLYYSLRGTRLIFASEEKALFSEDFRPEFDTSTWEELLCFRYVAGEATPFSGVRRLLPGHYLLWKDGKITTRRWWNLAEKAMALREDPPADPTGWFRETFDSAVDVRRISDVPLGVLLSGGLDSTSVAASLTMQTERAVASFTVRFDEPGYDEGAVATEVAARWGLEHHELVVPPEQIPKRLFAASWLSDEPLVHDSDLFLWAISEYAKPRVTVLLSGEGADETLCGYVRYRPLRHRGLYGLFALARPWLGGFPYCGGGRLRKLARFVQLGSLERLILFSASNVLPPELQMLDVTLREEFPYRHSVLAEAKVLYPNEPVRQLMYSDQHTFLCSILDRNDRMTMGASVECRVPFLDHRLVEGLAALPTSSLLADRRSKPLLRAALQDRLPRAVLRRRKWGFGAPWTRYLRQIPELRDLVADIPNLEPASSGPFDRAKLKTLTEEFLAGKTTHEALVKELVMLVAWHRVCIAGTCRLGDHHAAP